LGNVSRRQSLRLQFTYSARVYRGGPALVHALRFGSSDTFKLPFATQVVSNSANTRAYRESSCRPQYQCRSVNESSLRPCTRSEDQRAGWIWREAPPRCPSYLVRTGPSFRPHRHRQSISHPKGTAKAPSLGSTHRSVVRPVKLIPLTT